MNRLLAARQEAVAGANLPHEKVVLSSRVLVTWLQCVWG